MAERDSVLMLKEAGHYYDALGVWIYAFTKAGKLSHPDINRLIDLSNLMGGAISRARDAVATAIIRNNKGSEPWASIGQSLPFIQYNTAEVLGDQSPLTRYRNEPKVGKWPNPPASSDGNMSRTLPDWTRPQATTIAAALPAGFDAWMMAIRDAFLHAAYLVDRINSSAKVPPPPSTNLAPSSSPASGPASSPPASGSAVTDAGGGSSSKGKGAILAALALGALLFMPRKRRRST